MIVFSEANFMLPPVIFGFHSWDNGVFPDVLKCSCCVTCLCVVQTLSPFCSHALRDLPSNALNPKIFVSSLRRLLLASIKQEPGWFKCVDPHFDGKEWTWVWFRCLCLFFSISVGFLARLFENVELFQDEKCWFSWSVLLIITPFSQSQEYKDVIYRYWIH